MRLKRKAFGFIVFLLITLIIVISSNIYIGDTRVDSIEIQIAYPKSDTLINNKYIKGLVDSKYPKLKGEKRRDIELDEIEEYLSKESYIEDVDVFITYRGKIKINILQVEPIVRIFAENSKQYYIDKHGKLIPYRNNYVSDVVIANGEINIGKKLLDKNFIDTIDIPNKAKEEIIVSKLYYLASKLYYDTILTYQIDQIYIQNQNEFELYPKIGDYKIEIGNLENLDTKFTKLKYLYKEAFTRIGWDNYSKINLNYRDQVICTKKD